MKICYYIKVKRYIIFIILLFIVTGVLILFLNSFALPNTYLGATNIGLWNKSKVRSFLISASYTPVRVQVVDKVYTDRYEDLGIRIDINKTLDTIFNNNTFSSFFKRRTVLPEMEFTQNFYSFAENNIYNVGNISDEVRIDQNSKQLTYIENEQKYQLDSQNLRDQIIQRFGTSDIIHVNVSKIPNEKNKRVLSLNQRIEYVFGKPVTIIVKREQSETSFALRVPKLKELVTVESDTNLEKISIKLDEAKYSDIVSEIKNLIQLPKELGIQEGKLKSDLLSLMSSRTLLVDNNTIILEVDYQPTTSGTIAQKYIEVDISQQRMYLFENGSILHRLQISSGLYYPTPRGQFKILNKATNAFSKIYNVWMPHWMAFYYSPIIKAYFGIHELPYSVRNGEKIQRPPEFIGSPHTGGCIALGLNDSQKVYNFAELGMPVIVVD